MNAEQSFHCASYCRRWDAVAPQGRFPEIVRPVCLVTTQNTAKKEDEILLTLKNLNNNVKKIEKNQWNLAYTTNIKSDHSRTGN